MVGHVGVVGAGAIGSLIGCVIAASGSGVDDFKVTLVGRDSLMKAVEDSGKVISFKTIHGEVKQIDVGGGECGVKVTKNYEELNDADVIIVAVKSGATEEVCRKLADVLTNSKNEKKTVISFQNGVSNVATIQRVFQENGLDHYVVPGMVEFNVVWERANFFQTTEGKIYMSESPRVDAIAKFLRKGGLECTVEQDITAIQYGKLLINMNNAVNALSGKTVLSMMRDGGYRTVLSCCIAEGIEVLNKSGIPFKSGKVPAAKLVRLLRLPDCVFRVLLQLIIKIDPASKGSMLQDLEKNKLTEVDFLNGEIVRLAEEHGLPEPKVNVNIVRLIREAEQAKQGPPCIEDNQLLKELGLAERSSWWWW